MNVQAEASAQIKDQQRKHWNTVADGWGAWIEWTERNNRPLTDWIRRSAGWQPGSRTLDVACGPGYPALAAARAVRPGGRVVATDLSANMIAVAVRNAKAAGLDDIEFVEMESEALRFADASFDSVTNAYGLMFSPDMPSALSEAHRVLVPGGRLALVTWDEPPKSPFFTVIRGVAERFMTLAAPDPSGPGPFRLAAPAAIRSILEPAGFLGVQIESLPVTFEFESVTEYCRVFTDFAWKSKVAEWSDEETEAFQAAVAEAARPYTAGGRVRIVATSLVASARKPE